MLLEEMMKDEYSAGKADGERGDIRMLVSDLGELTADQNAKLDTITDSKILNELLRNVARAESMEEVNVIFKAL